VLLTRSPLEYPASWAFPFDLHVLSTPPAFVLSQDQTLHENLAKNAGRAGTFQHNLSQRDKDLTKQKLATPALGASATKTIHLISKKLGHTMPIMASDNSSTHYRVLKEHTPTGTTPATGRSPASFRSVWMRWPSPAQLFQPTRRSSRPATLGRGPIGSVWQSEIFYLAHEASRSISRGRSVQNPVSLPRCPLSGLSGAAPWRADLKKVTQVRSQGQIAWSARTWCRVYAGQHVTPPARLVENGLLGRPYPSVICAMTPVLLDSAGAQLGSYRRPQPFLR
jgi:hypothetical protein